MKSQIIESPLDYGILIELIFDDVKSFYLSFYISRENDFFRILLFEFSNNGPMKFQKLTLKKKFQDPASILEHKTNLAVNTLAIPYVQWWGRVKWLMGY